MTLGPVLISLFFLETGKINMWRPFIVFGRVPLFYYILHFYLIHLASLISYLVLEEKNFGELDFHLVVNFGGIPFGYGYTLLVTYLVWISVVVALYPLCKKYNQYKTTHKDWWLSYL